MDLSARFLSRLCGGAGWVLWLLVALSVVSLAIISGTALVLPEPPASHKATLLADMRALLRERAPGRPGRRARRAANADFAAAAEGAKAREKLRLEREPRVSRDAGLERAVHRPVRHGAGDHQGVPRPRGSQAGGPSVVMAGISEALVATAVGLMVAIPAVVAFNYFNRRVRAACARSSGSRTWPSPS